MTADHHPPLSPTELSALRLVADGCTNREISVALGVWRGENAGKLAVRQAREKLGGRNRAHLVDLGYRLGYLEATPLKESEPALLDARGVDLGIRFRAGALERCPLDRCWPPALAATGAAGTHHVIPHRGCILR